MSETPPIAFVASPADQRRSVLWACIAAFAIAGWAVRLGGAVLWPTVHRPDEIFQNLEPANRLWTGWGIISWEWRDGIRSWLFPDVLYAIMQATSLLGLPPEMATPAIWAVMSALATGVVVVGVLVGWRLSGTAGAVLCGIVCAFWPDLVYFGPKTLLEAQAGNLMVIAAGLASLEPLDSRTRRPWRLAAIGLLLGFGFALRFQLSLALGLVALWAGRLDRQRWLPLALGAAVPVALLGVIDTITWGSPFQSIWKNIHVNFVQSKADIYGVRPLTWYVFEMARRNGAALIPLALLFGLGARRVPLLAGVAAVVVVFHSLIAHKEISFIYAALPPAVIVVGIGSAVLLERIRDELRTPPPSKSLLAAAAMVWFGTVLLTGVAEQPFQQNERTAGLQNIWGNLRHKPDLCGLGLYGENFPWAATAGYTGLRRNIPMYLMHDPKSLAAAQQGFNYLVAEEKDLPVLENYQLERCTWGTCLLHVQQACSPVPEYQINEVMKRDGY